MQKKNTGLALSLATLGNTFWGLSYLFIAVALKYTTPPVMLSIRFTLAFLILNIMILLGKGSVHLKGKPMKSILLLLVAEPAGFYLESYGLKYCSTSMTGSILALTPIAAIVLGRLMLRESPAKAQVLSCAVPISGVLLCTFAASSTGAARPLGIFLIGLDCMSCAVYRVANRKASKNFTPFERTYLVLMVTSTVFTSHALIQNHGDLGVYRDALSHMPFVFAILVLTVFCSIASNIMVNYASGLISVAQMSAIGIIQTFVSIVSGIVILHDPWNPVTLVGSALILVGIFLVNKTENTTVLPAPAEHLPVREKMLRRTAA